MATKTSGHSPRFAVFACTYSNIVLSFSFKVPETPEWVFFSSVLGRVSVIIFNDRDQYVVAGVARVAEVARVAS